MDTVSTPFSAAHLLKAGLVISRGQLTPTQIEGLDDAVTNQGILRKSVQWGDRQVTVYRHPAARLRVSFLTGVHQ